MCRWCHQPLQRYAGGDGWVHAGAGGGFNCRDARSGMFLETFAEPAAGRHEVGIAPGTDTQRAAGQHLPVHPVAG